MIRCGITGHTGTLGKTFVKKKYNFKFIKFYKLPRQYKYFNYIYLYI